MEDSGHARWFGTVAGGVELRVVGRGRRRDPHQARTQAEDDRQGAQLILRLMLKDDFPQIWVPSWEDRDLRQPLWHRHAWWRRARES